jgi:hypothetical protein
MIEDLTNKLLDKLLKNISTPENIQKIQLALLDPVISYTYNRIYPYFMLIIIIFILTFILVLVILVILLKKIIY